MNEGEGNFPDSSRCQTQACFQLAVRDARSLEGRTFTPLDR
ncbi:hypothetical protein [Microcoleus sp. F4-D5]